MKKIMFVNLFTTIRLIGIFFVFPVYFYQGSFITGLFLIFIYLTDKIDGTLAKLLDSRTFFGSIYDGVCDKILNVVVFLTILNITKIALVPLIIEILIFFINILRLRYNQNMKTIEIGRIKMVILSITVVFTFLLSDILLLQHDFLLLYIPLILMEIYTFYKYLNLFIKGEKTKQENLIKKSNNLKSKLFDTEFYKENMNISYADAIKK